jgi:hypothetical protein
MRRFTGLLAAVALRIDLFTLDLIAREIPFSSAFRRTGGRRIGKQWFLRRSNRLLKANVDFKQKMQLAIRNFVRNFPP